MRGECSDENRKLGSCHFTFGFCAENPTFGHRNPVRIIAACHQPRSSAFWKQAKLLAVLDAAHVADEVSNAVVWSLR